MRHFFSSVPSSAGDDISAKFHFASRARDISAQFRRCLSERPSLQAAGKSPSSGRVVWQATKAEIRGEAFPSRAWKRIEGSFSGVAHYTGMSTGFPKGEFR